MKLLLLAILTFPDTLHLSLPRALDMALSNNPSLKSVQQKDRSSNLSYWNSILSYGITPTFSYSQTDTMPSNQTFNVSFNLFSVDRIEMVLGSRASALSSRYNLRKTVQSTVLNVEENYLMALSAWKTYEARKNQLRRAEENLKFVETQYRLGNVSRIDLLSAKVQAGQAKLNLLKAENDYRERVSTLAVSLGLPPETLIVCEDVDVQIDTVLPPLDSLIATAVRGRPDLQSLRASKKFSKMSFWLTAFSFLPSVSYNVQWDRTNGGDWSKTGPKRFISLQFDPLSYPFKVARGAADARSAELDYRAAYLQAVREVQSRYNSYMTAYRSYELSKEVLEQARLAYDLAKSKYQAGEISLLELFKAESDYADAEAQETSARYQCYIAKLELDYAIGKMPVISGE